MKERIAEILKRFPEVKWDRWAGPLEAMQVFGWIERTDGRSDFVLLAIVGGELVNLATSSAMHSAAFASRFGLPHADCRRVADDFELVKGGD